MWQSNCASVSGPASSERAFGDDLRQTPADGPLLGPKPFCPRNRAGPVTEIANVQGVTVHEPQGSCPGVRRVDHGLCPATVCMPHSEHDRRLVIGGWCDLRHVALERGKAGAIDQQSRITGNGARRAPPNLGPGRIKVLAGRTLSLVPTGMPSRLKRPRALVLRPVPSQRAMGARPELTGPRG
jgi:hypothetical protein